MSTILDCFLYRFGLSSYRKDVVLTGRGFLASISSFQSLDWLVIGLYFAVVFAIVWWVVKKKQKSSVDYFLASRHMGWFVIGASLFASNIGSEHLVGLAGSGAESGVAMAHYELHAWLLLVLGWVFVPFYCRSGVFTMPEFLEKRYSPASRWFLSMVSLISYVLTKVSVALYAGGIVFKALFPENFFGGLDNFWVGALSVVILTGIYTVLGGLRAVVYTDAMQAVVLIVGSFVVACVGLYKLGGWQKLYELCGSEYFNLWKPYNDPDFPWPGMLFCAPIVGLWYWCTDQYIVQRTLSAENETQARRGTIFGAYLKLTPVFIFIIPGMMAYALAKSGRLELGGTDQAFPVLVMALLPAGLRGLVVAGLLAALMSSLSSVFNSCSTLFTVDIYEKLHPGASEQHLVRVGRIATTVVVVLGVLWIPFMKYISEGLYKYLQSVQAYIAPPIAGVFLLGLFSRRINSAGCLAGLVCGFVIGMSRLVAELYKKSLEGNAILYNFAGMNFLYFSVLLFLVCVLIIVLVSVVTPKPSIDKLQGLTYATATVEDKEKSRASWNRFDVVNSLIILAIIAAVYLYFRG